MSLALSSIASFVGTRWGPRSADRAALLQTQERRLARFLSRTLPQAPFYRSFAGKPLSALPIVDKSKMLADFAGFNTHGVTLERALTVALAAEQSRDFRPTLTAGGEELTVGLSSGTSGTRGVFLVSAAERARWAGLLLGRLLAREGLRQVLHPRLPPLLIAFFLRANSNLYSTLSSRRIDFRFHDLWGPWPEHLERLNAHPPDVLTAPPTVLKKLTEGKRDGALHIAPRQVISVAEVLEADDEKAIGEAWGVPVQQVYQATEGFLGASCREGRVHLNEEQIHFEPEWLDAEHRRFHPIVTDFSRTTQLVVRYRLDDVLRLADGACPCGRPTLALEAIEGRADDMLWGEAIEGRAPIPVFPDLVRNAMTRVEGLGDYRLAQEGTCWRVATPSAGPRGAIERELGALADRLRMRRPVVTFEPWTDRPLGEKRRRIRCLRRLEVAA
ncbi:MAG TPA: F390 synthetase-related protein [Thermoanaerobaculia bacterium]|nr:F390 synthetase-related protein [Thermoanaerobaculia bacterium]